MVGIKNVNFASLYKTATDFEKMVVLCSWEEVGSRAVFYVTAALRPVARTVARLISRLVAGPVVIVASQVVRSPEWSQVVATGF